jgi:hypothetical protein
MNRRQLLAHISAAFACSQLPSWALAVATPITSFGAKAHLDLAAAKIIRDQFLASEEHHPNYDVLGEDIDLTAYSTASIEALECLAPLNGAFATLGFTAITPDMAMVLGNWKTYFLCFSHLQSLGLEAAGYLGSAESAHGLVFEWPMKLAASAIEVLVRNGSPLSITLQSAPDLACATALAMHEHELHLTLPNERMGLSVASALSLHSGYSLQISMPARPSTQVTKALASNPNKRVRLRSPNELNAQAQVTTHKNWLISLG